MSALFREEITRDINDLNKTWPEKIKSLTGAHLRDKETYLRKRRTSNKITTTEPSQSFVKEIYRKRAVNKPMQRKLMQKEHKRSYRNRESKSEQY